jgi:cysteine desulfuration protein SufE
LISSCGAFRDWKERDEYVIGLGKKLAPPKESAKTPGHLIKGCQSQVRLDAESDGKTVHFTAEIRVR